MKWPLTTDLPDPARRPSMAPFRGSTNGYGKHDAKAREEWQLKVWREVMGDPERTPQRVSGPLMPLDEAQAVMRVLGRKTLPIFE